MKIVAISDTHGLHDKLPSIPDGDVLIHAGDFTGNGSERQLDEFASWLGSLPHKHKIVIAGNHDEIAYYNPETVRKALYDVGVTYLEDTAIIIDCIKFYGSPWSPAFHNWYFMKGRGDVIAKKWQTIPKDTDVLIAHSPCYGILDNVNGKNVGCEELLKTVREIKPKAHVCGHIHEGYGTVTVNGRLHINASSCTGDYMPTNKPIEFEI